VDLSRQSAAGNSDSELLKILGGRSAAGQAGPGSATGKRRVLLVDDSIPFLRNFASILEGMGYQTATAENGLQALELLDSFQPQLVTLDFTMPELDGLGTLIRIKQRLPSVKVIFISAMLDQDTATNAILTGADECIAKPVSLTRLREVVSGLLN